MSLLIFSLSTRCTSSLPSGSGHWVKRKGKHGQLAFFFEARRTCLRGLQARRSQAAPPMPAQRLHRRKCNSGSGARLGWVHGQPLAAKRHRVHSTLHAAPNGQGVGHNYKASVTQHWRIKVGVARWARLQGCGALTCERTRVLRPRHPARADTNTEQEPRAGARPAATQG